MSLTVLSGSKVLLPATRTAARVPGEDVSVELTADGRVLIASRSGTPFVTVDFATRACTVDVLNLPHVDVAKRQGLAQKAAALPAVAATPKKTKPVAAPATAAAPPSPPKPVSPKSLRDYMLARVQQ
jgi:hypothetical protein